MKKFRLLCCAVFVVMLALPVMAQTPVTYKTAHYELFTETGSEADLASLAQQLELRFDIYNNLFRFAPSTLQQALKVRVFTDPASYDAYVSARFANAANRAIYLHYNNAERRELVVFCGSSEQQSVLAYQGFVQFFRAFIPNPPSWMLEGFSVYFSSLKYDPDKQEVSYEENLAWLNAVKNLGYNFLYPGQILTSDTTENTETFPVSGPSDNFSICSAAFVSFLMNSEEYSRTLSDSFMLLSSQNTAQENSRAVMNRFELWTDLDNMSSEYTAYLDSRKTFAELMESGRLYYASGNAAMAEQCFLQAQEQRPAHYAPYYYLGLVCYEEQIYDAAEEYYQLSLEYGADEALVSYALGVNAASAGSNNDARTWLAKAAALDPDRYEAKAEDLMRRMR